MLLTIDIGNTNTVFALFNGQALAHSWRMSTQRGRTSDEYASFLLPLMQTLGIAPAALSGVMIASVVPEMDFHIRCFCRDHLRQEPHFANAQLLNVPVALERPQDIGADRLVNALSIRAHYKTPAVVIDFGTATTFDVLNDSGVYLGGVIAPGIQLSVEALSHAAAKLPRVVVERPARAIGRDTKEAMQSGLFWGYEGLITGIIDKISRELGQKPFVLATGGLAPLFAAHMALIDTVDDALTLKGLKLAYEEIVKKKEG